METKRWKAERKVGREELDELMGEVFGGEIHAQRGASLSDGVDGVLHAASLGVRAIGHGLAVANGLAPRHAIKPVDRLLSNPKLMREEVARRSGRRVVYVESADGERRKAKDWLGAGGRLRVLRGARVTAEGQPVPMVVCVQQQQMQEPWLLASSRSDRTGTAIKHLYSKRFTVEETFRDVKNPRL